MNAARAREQLPDTLRAIAMLAVLVVNAIGYAVAPWGPMLGARSPADSAWAAIAQGLVGALLQGKGVAMLSFVFGMSLWLAARRRGRAEALQRGRVRHRRLLGLGIAHGVFVYFGDILTLYALVGRPLLRRLHMPWRSLRRHLWHALAWALLAKLAWVLVLVGFGANPDTGDVPSFASVRGAWPFLQLNASTYVFGLATSLVMAGPITYLCMVCGVAAARLRLLTHPRWRGALRRVLWRSGPALLALGAVHGWGCAALDPAGAWRPWTDALGDFIAIPLAACYLAALALASCGGRARWCGWFSPLGQRTLSLYIGHSLLCLVLFSGLGWALAASTLQTVLWCLALWMLALAAARQSRGPWPLEAWMARR
ncbi:DUF418 domain-containing protein [Pseudorhodoferax soli]|nr:DUF418 domain-containing protein [Pseudorhodoferax soli]